MKKVKIESLNRVVGEVCEQYGFSLVGIYCCYVKNKRSYEVVFTDINQNNHSLCVGCFDNVTASDSDDFVLKLDWLFCRLGCVRIVGLSTPSEYVAKIINWLCFVSDFYLHKSEEDIDDVILSKLSLGKSFGLAYAHKDNFVKISCNDVPIYNTIIEEKDGRVIFGNIWHSDKLK